MKTAAAYIRVSTDEQTEYSPASQLDKIRCYAHSNGYILPTEYIFADEGISGRNTRKRPEFNRMIGIAKQKPKPFDAILLWKFSRFARNREDSIVYKSMLRKQCGIDVISVSENIGDDKMSVLIEAMIEAMDEYYSINLGEEVRRGMSEKVSRGEAVTIPSFGYIIKDGVYIPDPEDADAARKIFTDFLAGKSMRKIADELNEKGLRTHRGNLFQSRTVRYILSNPVYAGKIRWSPNGKSEQNCEPIVTDGNHEPIITIEVWNSVCKKLSDTHATKYMRSQPPKRSFIMQGLIRCGSCNATLCRSSESSLQCYSYAHGVCRVSHSITTKKLDRMFLAALDKACCFDRIVTEIRSAPTHNTADTKLTAVLNQERCKLQRIYTAYENGVYGLDEFKQRKQLCESKIAEYEKTISHTEITTPSESPISCGVVSTDILTILQSDTLSKTDKNLLIKAFLSTAIFHKPSGDIDLYFYT